jgi:hypothetical protein
MPAQNTRKASTLQVEHPGILKNGKASFKGQLLLYSVIAAICVAYMSSLSPGHMFANDDFAAYIMHARNLAEGRPYAAIHYIVNPQVLWLGPVNGYPPVFPMMLAPVYKITGLNLRAFKVLTVLCFVAFLGILTTYLRQELSAGLIACVLLLVAYNPLFWEYRQYVLSEFPYLMFSFAALVMMQRTYANLRRTDLTIKSAVILSVLLYGAYGVRTIGVTLLVALALADIAKFRRPSRFLIVTVILTVAFILAQSILLTSPRGYVIAFHFSPRMLLTNAIYYGKTLSYVWQNGFSKSVQIVFALLFTLLATARFIVRFRHEKSAGEFYLFAYIAILVAWSAEIGLRGLLPVLPLYFVYGLEGLQAFCAWAGLSLRPAALATMIFAALTYSGEFKKESKLLPEPDVMDREAQEMFSFVRNETAQSEVVMFAKPRTLALFTGRDTASLDFDESAQASADFMRTVNATIVVQSMWSPPSWRFFLQANRDAVQIFDNSKYQVFRIIGAGNTILSTR